jgi:predicted RNase H-like HicB family nuclease
MKEALANAEEALQAHLAALKADGCPPPAASMLTRVRVNSGVLEVARILIHVT